MNHWRAGCGESSHAPFGNRPTEKDPSQRHLAGGRVHSEGASARQRADATRQIETAYFELKKSILGRRVLRAHTLPGITQEIYALLVTYQAIRVAIADATETTPGVDPDRASFSVALHTAREQLIHAADVIASTSIDLVGTIGRTVLNQLMPTRRLRVSPRKVKRPLSRYAYKGLKIDHRSYKATTSIDILAAPDP